MSAFVRWAKGFYALILSAFPALFMQEFGKEMAAVFSQRLEAAAIHGKGTVLLWCWREFRDLPFALVREWASYLVEKWEETMGRNWADLRQTIQRAASDAPDGRAGSIVGVSVGLLPPLVFGLALGGPMRPFYGLLPRPVADILMATILLGPLALGLVLSWTCGFPLWAYTYLGLAVAIAAFLSMLYATQSVLSALVPWLPLVAVIGVGLLIARSWRPLTALVLNIWDDWTRLSFFLYGAMPLLLYILFDEVPLPYHLVFLLGALALLSAGAGAYMGVRQRAVRVLTLLLGAAASWTWTTIGIAIWWSNRQEPWPFTPADGLAQAWRMTKIGFSLPILLLLPAIIGLAHHLHRKRAALAS